MLFLINKYLHRKGNVVSNDVLAKANAIIDCEEHLNQDLGWILNNYGCRVLWKYKSLLEMEEYSNKQTSLIL